MAGLHDVLHLSQVAALLVAYVASSDALCLVVAAVESDLHDGVRQLLARANKAALTSHDDADAFLVLHCAAAFGCQRTVRRLLQCGGIHAYAAMDSLPSLLLETSLGVSKGVFPAEVLYHAAARGDRETIAWLAQATVYDAHEAMVSAAAYGHLDVAYWLSTIEEARGLTSGCQWLLDEDGRVLCGQWLTTSVSKGTAFAAKEHGVTILKSQHDEGEYICAMDVVAGWGDVELLTQMHRNAPTMWPCTSSALTLAATNGHVDALQWLLSHCTELAAADDDWAQSAADGAARNGHLAVLRWLRDHESYQPTARLLVAALEGGHLDVLQWIRENGGIDPWSLPGLPSRATLVEAACVSANRLRVLQWLEQTTHIRSVTSAVMSSVLSHGDVRTAQWLADTLGDGDNLAHWNWLVAKWMSYEFALWHNDTLAKAACHGHMEIVQWLTQAGPLHKVDADTLWRCARSGHVAIVAFLLANPSHLPKGVEFLPASWTSFFDSVDHDQIEERAAWAWHRRGYDPVWARPYVELWLEHDVQACRRVPWLHDWAVHNGYITGDVQI